MQIVNFFKYLKIYDVMFNVTQQMRKINQLSLVVVVVVDGTTIKMARNQEASEDTEESPAGCAGEGKQSKGNQEKRKGLFKD